MNRNVTYTNPVPVKGNANMTAPDPFVLEYRGRYYCYSTDVDGVQLTTSQDLVQWEYCGYAYREEGRDSYWAPCVTYRNGTFYLYVSNRPQGSDNAHLQRMRVATSNTPQGPFKFQRVMADYFLIDADVVCGADGQDYMFYASNQFSEFCADRPGTAVVVDKMTDPLHLAGEPRPVILPTLDQEIFAENRFGDGRDWHTIEGSAYFEHRNRAYMTYSGNAYVREDYFMGYTQSARQSDIGSTSWTKFPSDASFHPLVRRTNLVEGTGHNSVIRAPNLVDWWLIYHGRSNLTPLNPDIEERNMRIDRLFIDGDQLTTTAPTATRQASPHFPTVLDLFDQGSLTNQWKVTSGRVSAAANHLETSNIGGTQLQLQHPVGPAVFEVWLRGSSQDNQPRFGMRLGATSSYTIWFDAGTNTIFAELECGNITQRVAQAPLGDFKFDAWQGIRVERSLSHVTVLLGNRRLLRISTELGDSPVSIAFLSQSTRLELGSFKLTEHIDWYVVEPGQGVTEHPGNLFESTTPLTLTQDGLRPVWGNRTLTMNRPAVCGTDLTFDLYLANPESSATICLQQDQRQPIRVELTPTALRLDKEIRERTGLTPNRTTLHLHAGSETVEIRCGDATLAAVSDHPVATEFSVQLELKEASLLGLTRTRTSQVTTETNEGAPLEDK